jgi:hypothetical protein
VFLFSTSDTASMEAASGKHKKEISDILISFFAHLSFRLFSSIVGYQPKDVFEGVQKFLCLLFLFAVDKYVNLHGVKPPF